MDVQLACAERVDSPQAALSLGPTSWSSTMCSAGKPRTTRLMSKRCWPSKTWQDASSCAHRSFLELRKERKAALMSELQTFVVVKLGERSAILKEQHKPVRGGEALGQCAKQGVSFSCGPRISRQGSDRRRQSHEPIAALRKARTRLFALFAPWWCTLQCEFVKSSQKNLLRVSVVGCLKNKSL